MRKINEIIVHCAATRPDWMADKSVEAKCDEIRRWHVNDNGWRDIGYHYLIDRDGQVARGRALEVVGAHVGGHNANSIGICLVGGHGSSMNDSFAQHYTDAQDQALRVLINELQIRIPTIRKISGHNDYTKAKACPGFNVARWLANKPAQRPITQSTTLQASAAQVGSGAAGVWAAVTQLDGTDRTIALAFLAVVILGGLWVMRERIKKWSEGIQ
jgi:N-acetylmuramoyl-L-alanine amidase